MARDSHKEWDYTVVDTSNNTTTIATVPTLVRGVYINTTLSAHTVVLDDGANPVITIPASATAGNYYDIEGGRFLTSFIVDPDDSSTGSITVFYRTLEYI